MYDELVKRLRDAVKMSEALAILLPHSEGNAVAKLYNEAADAIEELQGKIDEFYRLAQDVNRKEIAGHISESNLDTWLYAFHRYAAKIARKPLPEPPKEE